MDPTNRAARRALTFHPRAAQIPGAVIGYGRRGPIYLQAGGDDTATATLPESARIAKRMEEIKAEAEVLEADAAAEQDPDTRAQLITRSTTLLDEWVTLGGDDGQGGQLGAAIDREKRITAMRSANLNLTHLEGWQQGTGGFSGGPNTGGAADGARDHHRGGRDTTDPYADLQAVRSMTLTPRDMVARAETAIEKAPEYMTDDHKENATTLIHRSGKKQGGLISRHILITGSPAYHDSFAEYLEDPTVQRAALSLTSANGGYLVPFTLDPTVILTNAGSANPFRAISNVKRTATNTWNGVTSAGMNAAWLAEAGVVGDNSPTFGNIVITPQKASAWVFGSYEILEDSDVATEIPMMLEDAKDRLEEAAFCVGTGTGQPKGVVTAATTTVNAGPGVATYLIANTYALQAALPARFRRGAAWLMSLPIINLTRQFDTAGGSSYWTNLGQGAPERLLGGPIYESTSMAAVLTTGSKIAVYGDFKQYAIVDRIGMSVMYEPMVKDPTTGRPTGQGGWFAFWRVGGDALVPGAFRTLVTI